MRTVFGNVVVACACVGPVIAAQSSLDQTWWTANRACTIGDLLFQSEGRATVLFSNGTDAFGRWRLQGNTLTIEFSVLEDTFTGRYTGSQIRATHTWRERDEKQTQEEVCIFTQVQRPGISSIKKWCMAEPPHLHNVAPPPGPMLSPRQPVQATDSVYFLFKKQRLNSACAGRVRVLQRQDCT